MADEAANKVHKVGKILFYIVLLIEIGIVLIDKSAYINPIEGRLFQITFLLCMIKIVVTKYSLKEWLVMTAFFLLGAISYFVTGRNEIIRIVAFVAAAKDIPVKQALKVTFYVTLVGVLCLMGMSLFGIMGSLYMEADFGRGAIERRYCLGLGHPNALHCMVWALITLGIYLYMEKMRWYHYLILFLGNIGLYLLTVSRTGALVTAFTILLGLIFTVFPFQKERRWIYIAGMAGAAFCVLFSLLAAMGGHRWSLFAWVDKYLTGRIYWSAFHCGMRKWSLFSNARPLIYMDMGFVRLFFWYGIIPGIVYLAVKGIHLFYCYKKKDAAAFLVITMFVLYTVFEAHAISVYLARDYALLLLIGTWSDVFGLRSEAEGYFWQPRRILGRQVSS